MYGTLYLINQLLLSFPHYYLAGTEAKLSDKKKEKKKKNRTEHWDP